MVLLKVQSWMEVVDLGIGAFRLLFENDVVLLASSIHDLQNTLHLIHNKKNSPHITISLIHLDMFHNGSAAQY